jgi:general secretion pathway protein N
MSKAPFSLFALAVVVAAQPSHAVERVGGPLTAALEDPPAASAPNAASAADWPATAATPAPAPAPRGNPLWGIPLRALSATRDRPLFSPSRRPPAPVIAVAPAPVARPAPMAVKPAAPEPPPLALVGTIVGAEKRIAILFNTTTRQVTHVREGEEESGWRVRLVSPRSAVVEKDAQSVTLDLPKPGEAPVIGEEPAAGDEPPADDTPAAAAGPPGAAPQLRRGPRGPFGGNL